MINFGELDTAILGKTRILFILAVILILFASGGNIDDDCSINAAICGPEIITNIMTNAEYGISNIGNDWSINIMTKAEYGLFEIESIDIECTAINQFPSSVSTVRVSLQKDSEEDNVCIVSGLIECSMSISSLATIHDPVPSSIYNPLATAICNISTFKRDSSISPISDSILTSSTFNPLSYEIEDGSIFNDGSDKTIDSNLFYDVAVERAFGAKCVFKKTMDNDDGISKRECGLYPNIKNISKSLIFTVYIGCEHNKYGSLICLKEKIDDTINIISRDSINASVITSITDCTANSSLASSTFNPLFDILAISPPRDGTTINSAISASNILNGGSHEDVENKHGVSQKQCGLYGDIKNVSKSIVFSIRKFAKYIGYASMMNLKHNFDDRIDFEARDSMNESWSITNYTLDSISNIRAEIRANVRNKGECGCDGMMGLTLSTRNDRLNGGSNELHLDSTANPRWDEMKTIDSKTNKRLYANIGCDGIGILFCGIMLIFAASILESPYPVYLYAMVLFSTLSHTQYIECSYDGFNGTGSTRYNSPCYNKSLVCNKTHNVQCMVNCTGTYSCNGVKIR